MGKIMAIALNTFRESIRDRIFYSLLFFAVVLILFSMVLSNLTIGDPLKIIKDFGLGSISIVGTLIAIFVGIGMVYKEMEKRTIFVILSKPLARWQFLIGKYFGLSLTILVEVAVMSILLFVLCFLYVPQVPWNLLYAIIPIFFEIVLILAVAFLFSTFSTSFSKRHVYLEHIYHRAFYQGFEKYCTNNARCCVPGIFQCSLLCIAKP
ncbi:MAG: ABC transporter permease [Proteobacteria bacterium]|nr:ABC transporter permease [Pseudomonadota bacterium]